jgi:hypothetical protein
MVAFSFRENTYLCEQSTGLNPLPGITVAGQREESHLHFLYSQGGNITVS